MKVYSADKSELMDISAISRDGNELVVKGKIFGTMPMTARIRPEEARRGLRLLNLRMLLFLATFLFRPASGRK